jgi:hypothetical protein
VFAAFQARIVLSAPVFGGCGAPRSAAYNELTLSGAALFALPLLWACSAPGRWSCRLARTASVVALLWWLYMRFPQHGPRLFL